MPRTIELTVPPEHTGSLLEEIQGMEGLISVSLQRDVSVLSPGDVIKLSLTHRAAQELVLILERRGLARKEGVSFTANEPTSITNHSQAEIISLDTREGLWEDMESLIGKESNINGNTRETKTPRQGGFR